MPDPKIRALKTVPHGIRLAALEYLNQHPEDIRGCAKHLGISAMDVTKILKWQKHIKQVPDIKARAKRCAELREQLAEKAWNSAIRSQSDPKDLLKEFYEWCQTNGYTEVTKEMMTHYVALLRGQGVSSPRMLEGLGEMLPQPGEGNERPALFNLPPGTQVDMRIRTPEVITQHVLDSKGQ